MDGVVYTPRGAFKVRVRELSSLSAEIWSELPIESQCDAVFKKGPVFAAARVIWSNHRQARLRFYRDLDAKESAYLLNRVYHRVAATPDIDSDPSEICGDSSAA
jgi:hypothetical protein